MKYKFPVVMHSQNNLIYSNLDEVGIFLSLILALILSTMGTMVFLYSPSDKNVEEMWWLTGSGLIGYSSSVLP